jgi:hypothetical protein
VKRWTGGNGLAARMCISGHLFGNTRCFSRYLDHLTSRIDSKSIITMRLRPQHELKVSVECLLI